LWSAQFVNFTSGFSPRQLTCKITQRSFHFIGLSVPFPAPLLLGLPTYFFTRPCFPTPLSAYSFIVGLIKFRTKLLPPPSISLLPCQNQPFIISPPLLPHEGILLFFGFSPPNQSSPPSVGFPSTQLFPSPFRPHHLFPPFSFYLPPSPPPFQMMVR